jgi:hypothetical protein
MDTSSDDLYRSPKRKRTSDSTQYSPIVSPTLTRIATNLQEFPFARTNAVSDPVDRTGDGSPRTCVAVQLHGLDLQQDAMGDVRHTSKRLAPMSTENGDQPAEYQHPGVRGHRTNFEPSAPPQAQGSAEQSTTNSFQHPGAAFTFEAGELPSVNAGQPQMHRRSPPLDGNPEDNPMTWQLSEITGHDPNDPNDDGYGVNGIGHKPTPVQAWARSQRRRQQLAEYKSREAREARQRRSERRRMESRDVSPDDEPGNAKRKAIRVRFEDV